MLTLRLRTHRGMYDRYGNWIEGEDVYELSHDRLIMALSRDDCEELGLEFTYETALSVFGSQVLRKMLAQEGEFWGAMVENAL